MAERANDAPGRRSGTSRAAFVDNAKHLRRDLGDWLRQRRQDAGLTQADLAGRLGIRYYSFVSQVEHGIGRIPQDLYGPWAEALGLDRRRFAVTILRHLEPGLYELIDDEPEQAAPSCPLIQSP